MKPAADHATLVDLVARLERSNAASRRIDAPADPDARAELRERNSSRAAVARLPEARTDGHLAAYMGAGAVILGLLCLILLGQLTL